MVAKQPVKPYCHACLQEGLKVRQGVSGFKWTFHSYVVLHVLRVTHDKIKQDVLMLPMHK